MMQRFTRSSFVFCCALAFALLVCAGTAGAQVLAHSVDVSGHYGFGYGNYTTSGVGTTNSHQEFGFSGGENLSPSFTVLGEYSYMPMGSYDTVSFITQLAGGGVRFNLGASGKVVPYVLGSGGVDRFTGAVGEASASAVGGYVAFGGGASIYLGENWGIRPDFRYERQFISFAGITSNTNVVVGSGAIFFQFGGHGKSAKTDRASADR
jgi:hypothetical protein